MWSVCCAADCLPGCWPGLGWWLDFALWLCGGGSGLGLGGGLGVGLSQVGWGLVLCLWPGLPWFGWWFPLTLACGGGLAGSALPLFRRGGRFGFVFSLGCVGWVVGPLCEQGFLCVFVLRIISGPRWGLCGGALHVWSCPALCLCVSSALLAF